jgi:hypothetical protein
MTLFFEKKCLTHIKQQIDNIYILIQISFFMSLLIRSPISSFIQKIFLIKYLYLLIIGL